MKNNRYNIFVPKTDKQANNIGLNKNTNNKRIKYPSSNNKDYTELKQCKISIPQNNINITIDSKLDIKNKKILVLSLVRNIRHSYVYIHTFLQNLKLNFQHIKFCFFSNNNYDTTFDILDSFKDYYHDDIHIIKYRNESITHHNRILKLANYRNINFEQAINNFGTDFDYLIVFDSDLSSNIPVAPIVDSLKISNIDWSCISGNHCYNNSSYYYDELALRLDNDTMDIRKKFPKFDEYYGHSEHWLDNLYIINDWLKVNCAFGGISIYKMQEILNIYKDYGNLYDITKLPEFTAEHISINLKLQNATLINPNIQYTNSNNLEGKMYNNPIAFVPRDAGFFSVFNFYIGCLTTGMRAYPYFNKDALLRMNSNKNEHFCYWTESENCWFDYFEPVQFFHNDQTHTNESYKSLPKHRGELAPIEFRIPKDTHELIRDTKRFSEWRKHTHAFYKQYIKYDSSIIDRVDNFWSKNIDTKNKTIGIHYRHPSHFIESGKIYLEQYFEQIDKILLQYPDSNIYLATDSNFGIYAFQEKYGSKIKYISDIERLTMPEFLQWCFSLASGKADEVGFINGQGFELHHKRVSNPDNKKLTIDLLSEVICLSKCDYLVHTTSNVALAISYMNPELELISL